MGERNLWELSDLCTPWCVHVAATLRVADRIAEGTTHIDQLAAACDAHADSLQRVLRHLVRKGIFEETSPGMFALNDTARGLLELPIQLGLDLDHFGGRMANAWGSLLAAVRTGTPSYHTVFGRPFWEDLEAHREIAESFDALMGPGHGRPDPDILCNRNQWSSIRTVVDVGGGTGTLLIEILSAHPEVRGILVDLPRTVSRAAEKFREAGVQERARTSAQSFFEPLPAGADLYLLKSVLADWPDREAGLILKRCAEAARPSGRVVLLNGVSPDDDKPADPSILMMLLVGGKERSLSEFRSLAGRSGLEVSATERQQSGWFIVECRALL